jgi:hypothetical protein
MSVGVVGRNPFLASKARIFVVEIDHSEGFVLLQPIQGCINGWSREICRIAANLVLLERRNAARAIAAPANGRFDRICDISRSEMNDSL